VAAPASNSSDSKINKLGFPEVDFHAGAATEGRPYSTFRKDHFVTACARDFDDAETNTPARPATTLTQLQQSLPIFCSHFAATT
jgi:hypothetical protein